MNTLPSVADRPVFGAPLSAFLSQGVGRRQAVVLASTTLYLLSFPLPTGLGEHFMNTGWDLFQRGAIGVFSPSGLIVVTFPWFANPLLWTGYWYGYHSRWERAGVWGGHASATAFMLVMIGGFPIVLTLPYFAWLGSMLLLYSLRFFPYEDPAAALGVDAGNDPDAG